MKIMIDGDACSKIQIVENIANQRGVPSHIYCDAAHIIDSEYSELHIVDVGFNAADMSIIKHCEPNDIVITNDTGLAAMVLAKKAFAINNSGLEYTDQNIMNLLTRRHIRSSRQRKNNRNRVAGISKDGTNYTSFAKTLCQTIKKAKLKETE